VALAAGGAAAGLATRGPDLAGLPAPARALGRRIARRLSRLDVEDEAYRSFLADLEQQEGPLAVDRPASDALVQRFLLSTDFFPNGADETRTIRYARYHDPYVNPCWDPLNQSESVAAPEP
jgi:hypothetical protein